MNIENNDFANEILSKFLSMINENKKNIIFLYKGKRISFEDINLLNKLKDNNLIILVFNIKNNNNNDKCNYITCPKCSNLCFFNINSNYNISLDNCINNHKYDNIFIDDFIKSQNDNLENIECFICKNNINLYNNNFYICSCGKPICKLCLQNHNIKNHNIIEYNKRYYICNNHNKEFISYCKDCKINLCEKCEDEHYKHKIIMYKMEVNKIKVNEMNNKLNETKERINEFKKQFDILIEVYNNSIIKLKNNLEEYKYLINIIIYYLDNLKNYEAIQNTINFKLELINKDISNFLYNDLKEKINYLIDIFERYYNNMDIVYEINKYSNNDKMNIFGEKFVENNKRKSFLLIKNNLSELKENYIIKNKNKKYIKIKLFIDKKITNMSYMFYNCRCLSSISDISNWNTNNVTDMNNMFYYCFHLSSLPDISKWNTNNVTNMNGIFSYCNLSYLPDISKWNTNKVTNMKNMFNNCRNLKSLPDISKWNTN